MYFSHPKKIKKLKITFSLTNILLIITLFFSNFILATPPSKDHIVICSGQAYGQQWNTQMDELIQDVFAQSGLKPEIFHSPTKRAEHLFKNGTCDGFFASSISFPQAINREDIIHVPERVLQVNLEAFINPKVICTTKSNCIKDLEPYDIVGLFRSHALMNYISSITKASLVEIRTMNQGFDMLISQRISTLIVPVVNSTIKENFLMRYYESMYVDTITTIDLYLWLEEEYTPYIEQLNTRIKTLKFTEKWKQLIPTR